MATILVVDDDRMVCDLFRAVLSRHSHEVLTAFDGRGGVELFRQRRPRITVLDLLMPVMNGLEVLKEIRAIDPAADVIMLTGGATIELEYQAREVGVTDFLRKGLSLDVLIKAMERVLRQPAKTSRASTPSAGSQEAPSSSDEMESILVVDDEPKICSLISQYLTKRGYRVRVAQDGPTALALVDQEPPDLIVLDVHMPGMNGIEVLKRLQAKNYAGGVLLLTASQDEKLLQEALEMGSVDVMSKPVDLERLELAVQLGCILAAP